MRGLQPVSFLADTTTARVRWLLYAVPFVVVAASVAQRASTAPLLPVVLVAALGLVPFVLDPFGWCLPSPIALALITSSVFGLAWWWPADGDVSPFLLVISASVGAFMTTPRSNLAGAVVMAALPIVVDVAGPVDGVVVWSVGVLLGWFAGVAVRRQMDAVTQLDAANALLTEKAAADERRRIAGELHDVVAHSLAVTMLNLTGARLALEADDREEALGALRDAERLGRASLNDIRRSAGLLAGDAGAEPALPAAAQLPELVEQFRCAGLPVRLDVAGDLEAVSAASGLALYRITQESLANVVKHAPGCGADVELLVDGGSARLTVGNRIAAPVHVNGTGWGLRGMRERAESLGGSFRATSISGRWVVEAEVPR